VDLHSPPVGKTTLHFVEPQIKIVYAHLTMLCVAGYFGAKEEGGLSAQCASF
jgi:hypothetical protein